MHRVVLRLSASIAIIFVILIAIAILTGRRIPADVFIYQEGFGHASVSYVLDLQTSRSARISNTLYASYPAYSPDGSRLAYFSYTDDNLALYLANRNSANNRILLEGVTIANVLSWSPDSQHVAILLEDSSLGALGVVNTHTEIIQSLLIEDVIRDVMWFSNHELLIMTGFSNRDSARNYYHYDLDTETLTRFDALTPFIDIDLAPTLDRIAGTDNRGNLWLWDYNTSEMTNLTRHGSIIRNPTWSSDGQYIAYNVALGDGLHGLYVYSLETMSETEVVRDYGRMFSIIFLADNRLIFIRSNGRGGVRGGIDGREINIVNPDGTGLRLLIFQEEISNHLIWRPE